jgi:hypothetical protein
MQARHTTMYLVIIVVAVNAVGLHKRRADTVVPNHPVSLHRS